MGSTGSLPVVHGTLPRTGSDCLTRMTKVHSASGRMLQASSLCSPEAHMLITLQRVALGLGSGKANVADGEADGDIDGPGESDAVGVGVVVAAVGCGVGVGAGVGGGGIMLSQ